MREALIVVCIVFLAPFAIFLFFRIAGLGWYKSQKEQLTEKEEQNNGQER